ncbi:MAG: hypothetical protein HOP28_08530 [Gemmatimonadales bacterium]|nr:hypothetical protein [Gemmatimonadales bacterium]
MRRIVSLAMVACLAACRGEPPRDPGDRELALLVDSLRPDVERAAGLPFRGPTTFELRSKEEVRDFLLEKLRQEFPPERQEGIEAVYTLLGLLPDTLDLKQLLLDLYTEQVAGFYDPERKTLYGVRGADPAQLRLVLAHELVHALQHQYLPLDSIMHLRSNSDRQTAVQAVLEGQATLASIRALTPGTDLLATPEFWQLFREQIKTAQSSMEVFSRAPLALKEGLIFPYLNGAEFMKWWDSARAGHPLPSLDEMPRSTEQILHTGRYDRRDLPVPVAFDDAEAALYEDTMGELELHLLRAVLQNGDQVHTEVPAGWGGDRFRAYRSPNGPALVWYLVWDDAESLGRFLTNTGRLLERLPRAGYRTDVSTMPNAAAPTLRIVIAPTGWARWSRLPTLSP